MRYSTNYDIGDRKRGQGIDEDSVSLTVFEEGHRDGYRGQDRPQSQDPATADDSETADATDETAVLRRRRIRLPTRTVLTLTTRIRPKPMAADDR